MDKKQVKDISWVKRGKQRREIIIHLKKEGTQTPSEVSKKSGYSLNHTSRILNEFKDHKIVQLLNPEDKTGRLYVLTSKGKIVREAIKEKD